MKNEKERKLAILLLAIGLAGEYQRMQENHQSQPVLTPVLTNVRVMEGMAAALLNRINPYRNQPKFHQFNFKKLMKLCLGLECWQAGYWQNSLKSIQDTPELLQLAMRIARRGLEGRLHHSIGQCTHYHPKDDIPNWAIGIPSQAELSHYWFYQL